MKTLLQTVTLKSPHHYGRRVPPQFLGPVLEVIPNIVRHSIRMAVEGRSRAKGKRPDWLCLAADIRFVGHSGDDETVLQFEAPALGAAAPKLYEQGEFWPTRPDPSDTGFDLLGDVVTDVAAGNADSERFDPPLLGQVAKLRPALSGPFSAMSITGQRYAVDHAALVTATIVETARAFYNDTPSPRRVRLVGKLDMLRASTQAFGLILDDGHEIPGVLTVGDIAGLTPLFKQRVLVLGKAVYRPSGRALRIDADEILAATEQDRFFTTVPPPRRHKFDLTRLLREQPNKKSLAAIFGKWPGDESDEQIEQALKDLS